MFVISIEMNISCFPLAGYLHIVSWPPELNDFSVFKNLQRIDGVDLFQALASLVIQDSLHAQGPFYLTHVRIRRLCAIQVSSRHVGNAALKKMRPCKRCCVYRVFLFI